VQGVLFEVQVSLCIMTKLIGVPRTIHPFFHFTVLPTFLLVTKSGKAVISLKPSFLFSDLQPFGAGIIFLILAHLYIKCE